MSFTDNRVATLLHISDLHRTATPRLSNLDLLSAIFSDATRWNTEGIPKPDLIVVSGDLIQGTEMGSNSDSEIVAQYDEVGDFLQQLAAEFVDSDRSRVIIVPGNHDVHWGRALSAMKPIINCPDGIAAKAFEARSGVRWNWSTRQAYEIADRDMYNSRFEHFRQFRSAFYADVVPSPLSHGDGSIVFVEYPDFGIAVAGFSSWFGNDCFCPVGDIDPSDLASSQGFLRGTEAPIGIAVWHHGVMGGPRAHDYMDQRVIHRLVDFGFSVGLHGHQHFPGAAPFELHLPNLTSMAVIGAGSLAVGDSELPMGEPRQFNIVVIDPNNESITVHVRGMSPAGIFSGSHRDDFGGNTFTKLRLPISPSRPRMPSDTQLLDEAMTEVRIRNYEKALEISAHISDGRSREKRKIKIKALEGLGRDEQLIELLDPPENVDEAVKVVSILLNAGRFDEATVWLENFSNLFDPSLFKQLSTMIAAKRTIS